MKENRDQILDVGRVIAIICVMLYHYYSRWFDLYPYGEQFNICPYGYLGVEYFFILSGYFIFKSLERAQCFSLFFLKKIVRLWATLFIASILIFILCGLLDIENLMPQWHSMKNLIASITFISPDLFHKCGLDIEYINGSYWFLWVEIQFILLTSIIYFIDKRHAYRNILVVFTIIYFLYCMIQRIVVNSMTTNKLGIDLSNSIILEFYNWLTIFNVFRFIVYFFIGIGLYFIRLKRSKLCIACWLLISIQMMCEVWRLNNTELLIIVAMIVLLFVYAYFSVEGKEFVYLKPIASLVPGIYFVYVIHEPIGVLLIHTLKAPSTGCLLIVLFLLIGLQYYRYVEKQLISIIESLMSKKIS